MKHSEKNETPEMETREHSRKFLMKAAKKSGRMIGKRKARKAE